MSEADQSGDPAERVRYAAGIGSWLGVHEAKLPIGVLLREASRWGERLEGIEKPWLCWNVDSDWCVVQQRLVRSVGWTPIVGFDPRVGPPPVEPGAVLIDFNEKLRLPTMWMHFPMEFIFRFCNRLAFWHADCLIREEKMRRYAEMFANLRDGEMAAVKLRKRLRTLLSPRTSRRYWEVLGCSTRGASRSQFENGCGWWIHWAWHAQGISRKERGTRLENYYWDSGGGIWFWEKQCHGKVQAIPEGEIAEGHFTGIGRKNYKRASPQNELRDLSKELSLNTDLREACVKLGIERFLPAAP
jgi:hypothetical protein